MADASQSELARVLFVAPSAYTLSGLATWLDYLLPGLTGLGWDVTLGLVEGPRHHKPEPYLAAHPFAQVESIACMDSTAFGRVRALRDAMERVDPQIILSVNIPDSIRAAALERSQGRNVRAVATCHGIQEDLFTDMRSLANELDAVVCTNRLACKLAEKIGGVPSERIFHCPYGTDVLDEIPPRPTSEAFTVGYAGRLEQPQKRIHDLVEIAAELRNRGRRQMFLIAGSGPEENAFRSRINELELADYFEFLGFVPAESLIEQLYSVCDAVIVPSSWETGPIVIWESMAAGTPVVSSHYIGSGLEELLWHDENCLMYDIGDISSAADQLASLEDSVDQRERIRKAAFESVTTKLSCEISVRNWSKILKSIHSVSPRTENASAIEQSSGRLSKLLGPRLAESVRTALGKQPPDGGPGGEWPHTLKGDELGEERFFELAGKLDQRQAQPSNA